VTGPGGNIDTSNPTFARRVLAAALTRHRELHGLSVKDLARVIGVSSAQASKLDNGKQGYSVDQVEVLAKAYELAPAERDHFLELADEATRRQWWQQVSLSEEYRTLIGLEQAATSIQEWCANTIPGLLQEQSFALANAAAMSLGRSEQQIAEAVEVRLRRQEILDREKPPRLSVIMDEASLARRPGTDPGIMRRQLGHLLDMADRPDVTVRVIPFSAGVYPNPAVQFILLQLPQGVPPSLYEETSKASSVSDNPAEIEAAERAWEALLSKAVSQSESLGIIRTYLHKL